MVSGQNPRGLDWSAIGTAAGRPFVMWAAAVILVAMIGRQPGIVCVTPMAWLMATWVGGYCVSRSRSPQRQARLIEAALAGGLFGLLLGLLFAGVSPMMGVEADEQQNAMVITLLMILAGTVISAVLSLAVGAAQDRKRLAA